MSKAPDHYLHDRYAGIGTRESRTRVQYVAQMGLRLVNSQYVGKVPPSNKRMEVVRSATDGTVA